MPKEVTQTKARTRYATQACTICRTKKSRCDGERPVCGSCTAAGREDECSWGRDTVSRKPRTEAHFEALRKRADALQAYVDMLEGMLAKCVCQDVSGHLRFRPPPQQSRQKIVQEEVDSDTEIVDSDGEITKELTLPTQSLKARLLDDNLGNLLVHGVTSSTFRFGSRPANQVSRTPEFVQNPNAFYVLQLDGVDISQTHPDIDWSRYLPPAVALERREHDKILDLSFKFFTMFACRVVPSLFFRDMYRALSVPRSNKPPRTPHYSPMLHNAILSVNTLFSDDPYLRDRKTRQIFANTAKALLEGECRKPDISLVHGLAFIGTFHADLGERIQAELFFGQSSRLSITLGLGVDATPWVKAGLITRDEQAGRHWANWTIFTLNVCWALYFGRDLDFCGPSGLRRQFPMPPVDAELDQIPWFHLPANIAPQPNYTTLVFSQTSALFIIAREIIDVVNGLIPSSRVDPIQIDEHVTKIDLELNTWKSDLPPDLDITPANRAKSTPQRLILHLGYWWSFITLHRPFFNRRPQKPIHHSDREIDHVKLCTRAAENILELTETWQSLYTLRLVPVMIGHIVFSAATVFVLRALQATTGMRIAHTALNTALAQVETCISYLDEAGATWPSAARTKDILQAILNDRLRPVIARRLTDRGVQVPSAPAPAMASSSLPKKGQLVYWTPVPTYAGAPIVTNELSTMPAPTYEEASGHDMKLVSVSEWSQQQLSDIFPPTQQTPDTSASATESLFYPMDSFADVDMTALLPNVDYFEFGNAPELWEKGLSFDALDLWQRGLVGEDFAEKALFP
ncbi:Zn(2)-C6 fungal-type domain-containing protein [Mycena venus]|uniref:Zn(2)-C6 fungal-type domain-containing protein n=1 Tax=Mycena venus TaxID=2733690 RepID=A0A8H6XMW6_9AGAR|nr:Zn(2)-C6 fungal-type domain-containing protein [Mycena venus]